MAIDQKGHRRYHATIERALALFDANSEWADYIAFLTRLLKSIDSNKPEGLVDIPCKARIALCLSRCLQASLPSGVHQKALDVYAEIFATIESDGLQRDLALYLPGLSRTLAFANLITRPIVLDLYETYILKLPHSALRPALKALTLSLLPVIEEETSEDFDRCLHTFDAFRQIFAKQNQESYFWQTLFIASIANSSRRAGVLVYLARFLPKLNAGESSSESDQTEAVTTPEPGLLVRCFATGLRDEQPLIQRGFLDLLVTHLPLREPVLQAECYRKDLDVLVSAAITVVLRRDMSLNRRLWTWLTEIEAKTADTSVTSPTEILIEQKPLSNDHFLQRAKPAVVRSILQMLETSSPSPTPRTIPFRIMLSLMDRWEIGGPVVKATFAPLMEYLMLYQSTAPSQSAFDEVFRSANVFFDGIESSTLFICLSDLLHKGESDLLNFIIANFSIEQVDAAQSHIVSLSVSVSDILFRQEDKARDWSSFLIGLMTSVPLVSLTVHQPPNSNKVEALLESVCRNLCVALEADKPLSWLTYLCTPFEQVVNLAPTFLVLEEMRIIDRIGAKLNSEKSDEVNTVTVAEVCAKLVISLLSRFEDLPSSVQRAMLDLVPVLVFALWSGLGTATPQFQVITTECIWGLNDVRPEERLVESSVLQLLGQIPSQSQQQIERFGMLYHHTKTVKRTTEDTIPPMLQRAVLYILDNSAGKDRSESGVQWILGLQDNSPIFKLILGTQPETAHEVNVTMQRVEKLVHIIQLSSEHWKVFCASANTQLVTTFCLDTIRSAKLSENGNTHEAFLLLSKLYSSSSANKPSEELLASLVEMLKRNSANPQQQEEALDTLLAVLDERSVLPSSLIEILLQGLASMPIDERLDKWITLFCNFLPNHTALLPNLLKVTSSFCKRVEEAFDDLQAVFNFTIAQSVSTSADRSIANLLSGLEYMLARAHQQVFESSMSGGQITNGVQKEQKSDRSRANDRLTVVLCMQDAARICARLWLWKSSSQAESAHPAIADIRSFQYVAMKLRSRTRKILENLIEAESQECLETLIEMKTVSNQDSVLDLLQTLNGARPRAMMPAVFNAIYSRTTSANLHASQKSTVSIQIGPVQLTDFLIEYTTALEDDMLEEIWSDCAGFLREILANPMPHRQILIRLLRFCAVLARKMDNTSFGEDSRMHRELADICARLFTAVFTIKPAGFDGAASTEKGKALSGVSSTDESILPVLVDTLPYLSQLLTQSDRLTTVYTGIASNITSPSLRAKNFPQNLTVELIEVLRLMSSSPITAKVWRKDMLDSFSNPKFFRSNTEIARQGWLPLLKQIQASDKTVLGDCLSRIIPPAAAGIMLGIGAAAARTEADRRTQLELKRVATCIVSLEVDAALPYLQQILQRIEELLGATLESSPSLATRADLYLLIRALLLKFSHGNLLILWPLLEQELQNLCEDMLAKSESKYNSHSKLQGAKLLDLLLLLRPDDFQLHEWLYVTDTIDAIYPPQEVSSVAYADAIGPLLGSEGTNLTETLSANGYKRKPWLHGDNSRKTEDVDRLLASFFGQLSIRAFEDLYSLETLDEEACLQDLIADLFTGSST